MIATTNLLSAIGAKLPSHGEPETGPDGHQFQSLITQALWQALQLNPDARPSGSGEAGTVTPAETSGKTPLKKNVNGNHLVAVMLTSPATVAVGLPLPILMLSTVPPMNMPAPTVPAPEPAVPGPTIQQVPTGPLAPGVISIPIATAPKTASIENHIEPSKKLVPEVAKNSSPPSQPPRSTATPAVPPAMPPATPSEAPESTPHDPLPSPPALAELIESAELTGNVVESSPVVAGPSLEYVPEKTVRATSEKNHGTPAAQEDMSMKKSENRAEVAGRGKSSEKVLPVRPPSDLPGKTLPTRFIVPIHVEPVAVKPADISLPDTKITEVAASASTGDTTPAEKSAATDSVAAVGATDTRIRAIERTHVLMSLHAIQLRDSSAESLRIVIKPDAGMQLSLELRQRGENIDIRATLQQGNFDNLNQQWPELQQRLEQRGIKLASLAETPSTAGGETFSQNEPRRQTNQSNDEAAPDVVIAKSIRGAAPRQRASGRLDTWA